MEVRSRRALHAVRRPQAATGLEVRRARRMPVAREEHGRAGGGEASGIRVEQRDDRITFGHAQRPARTKVVLHVDDDERIARGIDLERHRPDPSMLESRRLFPKEGAI